MLGAACGVGRTALVDGAVPSEDGSVLSESRERFWAQGGAAPPPALRKPADLGCFLS